MSTPNPTAPEAETGAWIPAALGHRSRPEAGEGRRTRGELGAGLPVAVVGPAGEPDDEILRIDERTFPWPTPDTRAAIARAVQRWPRRVDGAADQGIEPGPAESASAGAEPPARARGVLVLRAAAKRAQQVYPGAAGELIHRELLAVAEFNYGPIGEQSLVTRLADQILIANPAPDDGSRVP